MKQGSWSSAWRKPVVVAASVCLWLLVFASPIKAWHHHDEITIGVLAFRGMDEAVRMWSPTAEYLESQLPGVQFRILPLTNDTIEEAVASGEADFVITNSGSYVALNQRHGITRIATLISQRPTGTSTRFGAVIISRADRDDIREIADLRGKRFAAIHPDGFGGWWMGWKELRDHGIEPLQDMQLEFTGFPVDLVMEAVRSGQVDAGTFRTELLEQWINEGRIRADEFHVLNARTTPGFPFLHSTRLYPEWPLAVQPDMDEDLAKRVLQALFALPQGHPALDAAEIAGWTIPLNYDPVHDLMRELKVGLYQPDEVITLREVLTVYGPWFAGILGILLTGFLAFVMRLNRSLTASRVSLANTLRSIGDAVVTTDTQGLIQYMNPVAERMGHCSLPDVQGHDYRQVFHLVDESSRKELGNLARHSASMREPRPYTFDGLLLGRDGQEYSVKITTSTIRAGLSRVSGCVLVIHDVTELRTLARQLKFQAAHDPLTGLVNRREFETRLSRAVDGSQKSGQTHVLIFLDLDWFKAINDSLGHAAGDQVLREVADMLERQVRSTDTAARIGGDEFGILLLNCELEAGIAVAEKLRDAIAGYSYVSGGETYRVGVSQGLVLIDRQSGNLGAILKAADEACYTAKEHGRNRYHVYSSDPS